MVDVQPPTQPKAFAVCTTIPPTQPKNFNRPPPTGPRLVSTSPGQLHPSHQPPIPETRSPPAPTQPDPGPAITDDPVEEEPEIKLPTIQQFALPVPSGKENSVKNLDKTVNQSNLMRCRFSYALRRSMNFCGKVI
ncbi:hypothetical protein BDM02DRAFT_3108580 [Thelephora ganbajun]|uniref:Uncharacterized protein n=1 Tax=Thelephora ganbajun TaxID=370292 RepID=A0ACB6ZTE3_THEGA|nr:hypothetical protein BDM02DRAFT_3108580 [Thelephora ganbajun]